MRHALIGLAALAHLGACASVNRGVEDVFRVDTVPQGASVRIVESLPERLEGRGCAPTPCTLDLPRSARFVAEVSHEGFETVELFVGTARRREGAVASHAATATNMAGATVVTAGLGAAIGSAVLSTTSGLVFGSLAGTVTLGNSAATAAGFRLGSDIVASAAPSTGRVLAGAALPAAAVAASLMVVDEGAGANNNLYPNPVIVALVPTGEAMRADPAIADFAALRTTLAELKRRCQGDDFSAKGCRELRARRKRLKARLGPDREIARVATVPAAPQTAPQIAPQAAISGTEREAENRGRKTGDGESDPGN